MGLVDVIPDDSDVAFDTDSIIYYVEENPEFLRVVEPVFENSIAGLITAHVSLVTLVEVLTGPLRNGLSDLVDVYRAKIGGDNGFSSHAVTRPIANRAAFIRARWNLKTPDAIIAATAIEAGCTHLVTNDTAFRRVEDLTDLVVSDYA